MGSGLEPSDLTGVLFDSCVRKKMCNMSKVTKVCLQRTRILNSRVWTQGTELARYSFSLLDSPYWGQDLLIFEASRSHSDKPHSVGLLWANDRPIATTNNIQKRETSMHLAGFEPAIPASEWPQTHALERAATGIGFQRQRHGIALRFR